MKSNRKEFIMGKQKVTFDDIAKYTNVILITRIP